MADYQILNQLHPMFRFANDVVPGAAMLVSRNANQMPEYNYCREAANNLGVAYYMKIISRRSPLRMATLFTVDWENNKQDFDQWIKDYSESPAVALTAARVYRNHLKDPKKSVEFYEKYLEKFPDASVLKELAQMQFNQSESDDWQKTLIRIFDTEDLGLQHSNTAAILAATLMRDGEYDLALEWAERANQSGSSLGMLTLQQCLTGLGKLDRASEMGRRNLERYGDNSVTAAYDWFYWCGANKHTDLDEAWSALQKSYKTHYNEQKADELILFNKTYYDFFERDFKRLTADLKEHLEITGNVISGFEIAIYSDLANDTKTRDEFLEKFVKGEKEPNVYSSLAKFLQKYFKSGKYDHAEVMKLYKKFELSKLEEANLNLLLILTRLKHDGDKLHKNVKRFLAKKLGEHRLIPRSQAQYHLTLVGLGGESTYFLEAVKQRAWVRIKPGEQTEEQKASEEERQKNLEEQILRARQNDFQMKRFLERKAAKKKAAEEESAKKDPAKKEGAKAE